LTPTVTAVRFLPASALDQQRGLMGWAGANLSDLLRIDGFVVRRTRHGVWRVFPPERLDRAGRRHRVVDVLDADHERAIEAQIIAALRERGDLR
jgi:hypothetical protein